MEDQSDRENRFYRMAFPYIMLRRSACARRSSELRLIDKSKVRSLGFADSCTFKSHPLIQQA